MEKNDNITKATQTPQTDVKVMEYLAETEGHGIIAGVHTQTMAQEELSHIHKITGKFPALCGFELSPIRQTL